MQNQIIKYVQGLTFIPILTIVSPFMNIYQQTTNVSQDKTVQTSVSINEERAEKIDAYFAQRDMPLKVTGQKWLKRQKKIISNGH